MIKKYVYFSLLLLMTMISHPTNASQPQRGIFPSPQPFSHGFSKAEFAAIDLCPDQKVNVDLSKVFLFTPTPSFYTRKRVANKIVTRTDSYPNDIILIIAEALSKQLNKQLEEDGLIIKDKESSLKRKRKEKDLSEPQENQKRQRKKIVALKQEKFTCKAKGCRFSSPYVGKTLRHLSADTHKFTNLIQCSKCKKSFNYMAQYYQHNTEKHPYEQLCLLRSCTKKCIAPKNTGSGNNMFQSHSKLEWENYIEKSVKS